MNATEHLHPHPPQDLLDAYDEAAEHRLIDGLGIQLWVEFDLLCHEYGIDPDAPRHELARIVYRPGGALPASGHSLEGGDSSARDSRADNLPLAG